MNHKLLPYHVILAAKTGDADAMERVFRHFDHFIDYCSRRKKLDEYGNLYTEVNQDVKDQIKTKLMETLIYKYDPTKLPDGETLEE